jgi:hypothetical protein
VACDVQLNNCRFHRLMQCSAKAVSATVLPWDGRLNDHENEPFKLLGNNASWTQRFNGRLY